MGNISEYFPCLKKIVKLKRLEEVDVDKIRIRIRLLVYKKGKLFFLIFFRREKIKLYHLHIPRFSSSKTIIRGVTLLFDPLSLSLTKVSFIIR